MNVSLLISLLQIIKLTRNAYKKLTRNAYNMLRG